MLRDEVEYDYRLAVLYFKAAGTDFVIISDAFVKDGHYIFYLEQVESGRIQQLIIPTVKSNHKSSRLRFILRLND